MRRLRDLQTMRAGFVARRVEWQNRAASVGSDAAGSLAQATTAHVSTQIAAVDQDTAQTIDHDDDLRGKRDLLVSIDGVGATLAAILLAEWPGPDTISSGALAVAYARHRARRIG